MGKPAAAAAACQAPSISQRPQRRKQTPGDAAPPGFGSRISSGTIQTAQIQDDGPLKKLPLPGNEQIQDDGPSPLKKVPLPGKRKKTDEQIEGEPLKSLRSCTIAASQVPVLLPTETFSWGAKRSRSALDGSRWMDWANLDEGPAGLIAERVLANDRRFYPRQWIMLRSAADAPHPTRRQFLNTSTGHCIEVDIPELHNHDVPQVTTAEGLLLLLPRKATEVAVVLLLNPLTRQMADLPGITNDFRGSSSAGLVNDSTVCLYFTHQNGGTLAIAKPGDDRWVLLNTGPGLLRPTIYFAGRFYGATTSAVMTVDMEAAGGPRLVVAAKLAKRFRVMTDSVHLVDNAGDLTLVHSMVHRILDHDNLVHKRMYMVYRVDVKAGKMRVTRNLGGHAIFMDYRCALSVSPQVFPFLSTDTIYLGRELSLCGKRGSYNLRDGSIEPPNNVLCKNGEFARPWSIADCLAAYVSI